MASISKQPNGRRSIQFIGPDKKRRTIRLGKVSDRMAVAVKVKVENLAAAAITGHALDAETARWVASLSDEMADKLSKVGLIPGRGSAVLGPFLDAYVAKRTDVKGSTLAFYGNTCRNLIEFFGEDKPLREITKGDADDFRRHLIDEGLSPSTVGRRCSMAKMFFLDAVRHELIQRNPLGHLRGSAKASRDRMRFITREVTDRVIDACPDAEWRLLVALARYGGLRTPSEPVMLRWEDVNWEHDWLIVHSPKTEHHPGGEYRVIPLFPELRVYLGEVWDQAEPGADYVIASYRYLLRNVPGRGYNNLRARFHKIIKRAGIEPWPKPWQNLRSTRETELAEEYPMHVVCEWIGNTQPVAMENYLQVTDDHFRKAAGSSGKALQNPVQHVAASSSTFSQADDASHCHCESLQDVANRRKSLHSKEMFLSCLGKTASSSGETAFLAGGAAESGAVDDDLAEVVAAWPGLPVQVKATILDAVRQVSKACLLTR